jgi:ABC-type nitrate/sulfonate/bicarbonate transport system substrate-binding protein
VKFIELPPLTVAAALEESRIDAATVLNPVLTQLVRSGKARVLGNFFDALSSRFLQAAWFTNADYASKHRDVITRFAAVMRDSSAYCNAHHTETIPLIAAFTGIDTATIATMVRPIWALTLDAKDLQPTIDAAAKGKLIDKAFDAHDLMAAP